MTLRPDALAYPPRALSREGGTMSAPPTLKFLRPPSPTSPQTRTNPNVSERGVTP